MNTELQKMLEEAVMAGLESIPDICLVDLKKLPRNSS
jgi:hypothetical protein